MRTNQRGRSHPQLVLGTSPHPFVPGAKLENYARENGAFPEVQERSVLPFEKPRRDRRPDARRRNAQGCLNGRQGHGNERFRRRVRRSGFHRRDADGVGLQRLRLIRSRGFRQSGIPRKKGTAYPYGLSRIQPVHGMEKIPGMTGAHDGARSVRPASQGHGRIPSGVHEKGGRMTPSVL